MSKRDKGELLIVENNESLLQRKRGSLKNGIIFLSVISGGGLVISVVGMIFLLFLNVEGIVSVIVIEIIGLFLILFGIFIFTRYKKTQKQYKQMKFYENGIKVGKSFHSYDYLFSLKEKNDLIWGPHYELYFGTHNGVPDGDIPVCKCNDEFQNEIERLKKIIHKNN